MSIWVEQLTKYYCLNGESIKVLEDLSFAMEKGEFVSVLGPSGCGKSTLLETIAGMTSVDEGNVTIDGKVCFMPQNDMLLPWLRLIDNAVLPSVLQGKSNDELILLKNKANKLLPLFGLQEFKQSYPHQLSGGMRQRVALLRTYLLGGDFWLLDEPFAKLDALTREELQDWLLQVWHYASTGVLFVTHDIEEAIRLSSRILLLSARPGRLLEEYVIEPSLSQTQALALKQKIKERMSLD